MDEKKFGLFLEQLSEGYEQKLKINQMSDVLKERADYLFDILDKYIGIRLETSSKDRTTYPSSIHDSNEEKLILAFKNLLASEAPPYTADDLILQLTALGNFYDFFSQSKTLPPPYLLMQIDNLTMKVVYTCGKRVLGEPLVAAKIEANRRGNITNRKLKERRAEIIYMAADELKIAGGEIPRRDQLRIQRKIERYLAEPEICSKYKLKEIFKNKKPPSVDQIIDRMSELT